MKIGFDNALGLYPKALQLADRRSELIASNLANADTPGYRAQDLPFHQLLRAAEQSAGKGRASAGPLAVTHAGHMTPPGAGGELTAEYRQPLHASLDQNSVDADMEKARFAENQTKYNASFEWLSGRFRGLKDAIRGE